MMYCRALWIRATALLERRRGFVGLTFFSVTIHCANLFTYGLFLSS